MYKKLLCLILVLGMAGAANAALISRWDMEDGAGTIATDIVGAYDATIYGTCNWVAGVEGSSALSFDEPNLAVAKPSPLSVATCVNDVSVKFWARGEGPWNDVYGDCPMNFSGGTVHTIDVRTPMADGNSVLWSSGASTGPSVSYAVSDPNIFTGQWVLWIMTHDSTAGSMAVYQDYELGASITGAYHPAGGDLVYTANIGAQGIGGGLWMSYHGDLDDVCIYDHALCAGEVLRMNPTPDACDLGKAWDPNPGSGTLVVMPDVVLSWTAGDYAATTDGHKVYFSTDFADVNTRAVAAVPSTAANYDPPGDLDFNTVYYWAVDEVNGGSTWAGEVSQFTTWDGLTPDPILMVWYKMDEGTGGAGTTIKDWSQNKATGTLVDVVAEPNVTWVAGAPGAIEQESPSYGLDFNEAGHISVPVATYTSVDREYTGAFWGYGTGTGSQLANVMSAHLVWGGTVAIQMGFPWFADNLMFVCTSGWTDQLHTEMLESEWLGSWNHWMFTKDADSGYMTIFRNGSIFGQSGPTHHLSIPGAGAAVSNIGGYDGANYKWDGMMDDWREYNKAGTESLAARLAGGDPGKAYWESPVDDTVEVAYEGVLLTWVPGNGAVTHTLNWGYTTAMTNVVPGLTEPNYALPTLDLASTVYWRVDEVSGSTVTGDVWEFTTLFGILVDDFEVYTTSANLRLTWDDDVLGYDYTFLEDAGAIVYNGAQCLRFETENFYSPYEMKVERSFDPNENWTILNIKAMSLWFRGDPTNLVQDIYVDIIDGESSPVTGSLKYPDSNAHQSIDWIQWGIDMTDPAFSSVNLANVDKLAFRVNRGSSKPGNGDIDYLYIDDIYLHASQCLEEYAPTCDVTGDCIVDYLDIAQIQADWLDCTTPLGAGCECKTDRRLVTPVAKHQIVVDGDLSDWPATTWYTNESPTGPGENDDITKVEYALAWEPTDNLNRIYIAVKVTDLEHNFIDFPSDYVVDEADLLTVSLAADPEWDGFAGTEYADQNSGQVYYIGQEANSTDEWAVWGNSNPAFGYPLLDDPDAEALYVVDFDPVDANTIVYELGFTTFLYFGGFNIAPPIPTTYVDMGIGQVVAISIGARTVMDSGLFGGVTVGGGESIMEAGPSVICGDWGYSATDYDENCITDLLDYAAIANQWLIEQLWP